MVHLESFDRVGVRIPVIVHHDRLGFNDMRVVFDVRLVGEVLESGTRILGGEGGLQSNRFQFLQRLPEWHLGVTVGLGFDSTCAGGWVGGWAGWPNCLCTIAYT